MSQFRSPERGPGFLRASAWIHLCRGCSGSATVCLGALAVWQHQAAWLYAGSVALLVWIIFALLHAFEGARACCLECRQPLFLRTRCRKHPGARRVLASHEFATSMQVIRRGCYRCHHCGTVAHRASATEGTSSPPPRSRSSQSLMLSARIPEQSPGPKSSRRPR